MKSTLVNVALVVASLGLIPALAANEIRVDVKLRSTGGCLGTTTTTYYNAGSNITLSSIAPCTELINIWAVDAVSDVGNVTISGTGSSWGTNRLRVMIGSGAWSGTGLTDPACGDFGNLTISDATLSDKTDFAGHIGGDLTDDIGVGVFYRLDVDGAIDGSVLADSTASGSRVVAGSMTADGDIEWGSGTLSQITVTGNAAGSVLTTNGAINGVTVGGDLSGSIESTNGLILDVNVTGAIGPSATINIRAMDGIRSIEAASINAHINGKYNGGTGIVHRVATTTGDFDGSLTTRIFAPTGGVTAGVFIAGDMNATVVADQDLRTPFDVDGDLNGTITVRDLWIGSGSDPDGVITIGGDANANITITRDLQAGAGGTARIEIAGNLNANIAVTDQISGRILIGGSLNSGKTISAQALTEGGTNGQIIINRANSAGTWSGSVVINSVTLATAPYYANTGLGGAVGLAPFQCHLEDCSPAHLAQFTSTWNASTDRVRLRHYGPITWTGMPVNVSSCDLSEDCNPNSFNETANWSVDSSPTAGGRDLLLQYTGGTLPADRHFHFIPVRTGTNMLKCADLTAVGDVPVADYIHTFTYEP